MFNSPTADHWPVRGLSDVEIVAANCALGCADVVRSVQGVAYYRGFSVFHEMSWSSDESTS